MTQLNQIVALEKGLKARTQAEITAIHRILQADALFSGFAKEYRPKDEEGEQLPPERKIVQATVKDRLSEAADKLTKLFDVVATKEWGNTSPDAVSDIVIGDRVLIAKVPVPYLLFLEKQLVDWRTLVTKLPVLDAADVWTFDQDNQQYRTEPTETIRSKKTMRALTLAHATDKHPAQVQTYNEDVPVGTWATTKFSGAVPANVRADLIDRANTLIDAVKAAREAANSAVIEQKKVAEALFEHLLPL